MTGQYTIWRDDNGIPHIEAQSEAALYEGQGFAHGRDRSMQILLMRLLGQGRLCEILDDSEDSLKVDLFFRRMNWSGNTRHHVDNLSPHARTLLDAYCAGINAALAQKTPLEFKLFGYKPAPWGPEDCILISRMVGYLTLAQSQGEIERLLIEMVQAGVPDDKLEALFPGLLGELDRDLLGKVKLHERIVPNEVLWDAGVPRMMASNNWVVAGRKTKSGQPILCNDPHLEVNRLPNVWCELVLKCADRAMMGGSMPGLPGILIGRNNDLAWGATYAFVDTIDSWVERCEKGRYFRQDGKNWHDFTARKETIKRKKNDPLTITFYENDLGTLEGDPFVDSHCLITRWAAADSGAATIEAGLGMFHAKTVKDGMHTYGQIETGWNYVFADGAGNIGFQMSGQVPIRRKGLSGLVPVPAWEAKNHWQGFIAQDDMPRQYNPDCGYICTANEDLNRFGKADPINMPMGSYRSDRIADLLAGRDNWQSEDMFALHFDVYSRQAEAFMAILRPILPDTKQGKTLADWDLHYDLASKGASLFEAFYKALYRDVFGARGMGEKVIEFLQNETGTFVDFYANFDRILLSETSPWFQGKSRDEVFAAAAKTALHDAPEPWGEQQHYTMTNIFFGGKLPAFLGFDRGPLRAIGGRATIHQGQIYRSGGRDTTFMPSYRFVADFAKTDLRTNLAGGPSDRRFSKWYCSDLNNWRTGKYKSITWTQTSKKQPF
jgi:penicillin amidase